MAIPRKTGPAQVIALVGQIGDLPTIPEKMTERFPELAAWQEEMDRWWARFSDLLQRDLDQISAQFKVDETAAASNLASINVQLATLSKQIKSLTP